MNPAFEEYFNQFADQFIEKIQRQKRKKSPSTYHPSFPQLESSQLQRKRASFDVWKMAFLEGLDIVAENILLIHIDPKTLDLFNHELQAAEERLQVFCASLKNMHPSELLNKPYQDLFGFSDTTMQVLYDVADHLFEESSYDQAQKVLTLIVTLSPYVITYWIALGVSYHAQKNFAKAKAVYRFAHKLNPNKAISLIHLLQCAIESKDKPLLIEVRSQIEALFKKNDSQLEQWEESYRRLISHVSS